MLHDLFHFFRGFEFYKEIRQIAGRSALLPLNVNKLWRLFLLIWQINPERRKYDLVHLVWMTAYRIRPRIKKIYGNVIIVKSSNNNIPDNDHPWSLNKIYFVKPWLTSKKVCNLQFWYWFRLWLPVVYRFVLTFAM